MGLSSRCGESLCVSTGNQRPLIGGQVELLVAKLTYVLVNSPRETGARETEGEASIAYDGIGGEQAVCQLE